MTVTTAAKHAADTTANPTKRHRTVELDESYGPVCDELADAKLTLAEAKARVEELTGQLKAAAGMNEDKAETLLVRIGGVLRAKIALRGRQTINSKLLQESFPEAFEAVRGETTYQEVKPA